MLFQPAIQLRSLVVSIEQLAARLSHAQRRPHNHAVSGANSLPCQPGSKLPDNLAVLVMEPELDGLPYPAFGGWNRRLSSPGCFPTRRLLVCSSRFNWSGRRR